MTQDHYRIVGRMQGFRPENIHRYEMHRLRHGGDLGHCNPARSDLNRVLIGDDAWAAATLARIDDIRLGNHNRRLESLERRKRKKDLLAAVVEGPTDPWRPTKVGPMRELILTANRPYFAPDLDALFKDKPQRAQLFETHAVAWLAATFCDAVVHARADHDETAYNIHAVIMPLAQKQDGRTMLDPSSHQLIKDYEKLQTALGEALPVSAWRAVRSGPKRSARPRDAPRPARMSRSPRRAAPACPHA